jgi:hypothetical protein
MEPDVLVTADDSEDLYHQVPPTQESTDHRAPLLLPSDNFLNKLNLSTTWSMERVEN